MYHLYVNFKWHLKQYKLACPNCDENHGISDPPDLYYKLVYIMYVLYYERCLALCVQFLRAYDDLIIYPSAHYAKGQTHKDTTSVILHTRLLVLAKAKE